MYSQCYLPQPPREWNRLDLCGSFIDSANTGLTNTNANAKKELDIAAYYRMLSKGNVLQYKKNSSNLTKWQRYSQIAKGKWVNRNTTWATQSTRGYTNPNNTSLKRYGDVHVAFNEDNGLPLGVTGQPVSCPTISTALYPVLPEEGIIEQMGNTVLPKEGNASQLSANVPPGTPLPIPSPLVIRDFGHLLCNVHVNPCSNEVEDEVKKVVEDNKKTIADYLALTNCHPSTDSDVPGAVVPLCWTDRVQTWYPRQRLTMGSSGNKFPVNAPLFSSVRPYPAVITSIVNISSDTYEISWIQNTTCIPVQTYLLIHNEELYTEIYGFHRSSLVTVNNNILNAFYLIGKNGNVKSNASNTIYIKGPAVYNVKNFNGIFNELNTYISLSWINSIFTNESNTVYTLHYLLPNESTYNSISIGYCSFYQFTNITTSGLYSFYLTIDLLEQPYYNNLVVSPTIQVNAEYPIYSTTGDPIVTMLPNNIIQLTYLNAGTLTFNVAVTMQCTLVAGGCGGGSWVNKDNGFDTGVSGGGGGHILNFFNPNNVIFPASTWDIYVGPGGAAGSYTVPGQIGQNSSFYMTPTLAYNFLTNNAMYAGGGGQGLSNVATPGGGANGSLGGAFNSTYYVGGGGGGGAVTYVNESNDVLTTINGANGQTMTIINGANGQTMTNMNTFLIAGKGGTSNAAAINGVIYSGGGGGGVSYVSTPSSLAGVGGTTSAGVGADIINNNGRLTIFGPFQPPINGSGGNFVNSGSGGGGGLASTNTQITGPSYVYSSNGASGVVIIQFAAAT